jgi:hypothetical protein
MVVQHLHEILFFKYFKSIEGAIFKTQIRTITHRELFLLSQILVERNHIRKALSLTDFWNRLLPEPYFSIALPLMNKSFFC